MQLRRLPSPADLVVAAVLAPACVLAIVGVVQLATWLRHPSPFAGQVAVSARWNPPPGGTDDAQPWYVSRGVVEPPPASADRDQLVAWVRRYYPVLATELDVTPAATARLPFNLGGGPPRALLVIPGEGLVLRRP